MDKTKQRIKIAVQKTGRLTEHSLHLLERCGLKFTQSKDQLFCFGENMPIDLLLVRDDDIPGRGKAPGARIRGPGDPFRPRVRPGLRALPAFDCGTGGDPIFGY
jgi:hypothetical protein